MGSHIRLRRDALSGNMPEISRCGWPASPHSKIPLTISVANRRNKRHIPPTQTQMGIRNNVRIPRKPSESWRSGIGPTPVGFAADSPIPGLDQKTTFQATLANDRLWGSLSVRFRKSPRKQPQLIAYSPGIKRRVPARRITPVSLGWLTPSITGTSWKSKGLTPFKHATLTAY